MIKFKQLNRHKPEEGIWGDCARTVLACLLEIHPAEVPHFRDKGQDGIKEELCWLKEQGLTLVSIPVQAASTQEALNWAGQYIEGCHYCLLGESSNKVNHIVICFANKIVHDPFQDSSGIVGPCKDGFYWIEVLAKTL